MFWLLNIFCNQTLYTTLLLHFLLCFFGTILLQFYYTFTTLLLRFFGTLLLHFYYTLVYILLHFFGTR